MNRLLIVVALALTVSPPAWAGPAGGKRVATGDAVTCTVRSIHGQKSNTRQIDPRLAPLRKLLSSPQWAAFGAMQLVEARDLELPQAAVRKTRLPNGKRLELTFKERVLAKRDHVRLRVFCRLFDPKSKKLKVATGYNIADGGTIVLTDPGYKGGILVLAITCKSR